jgi:hypothetical protein
MPKRLTRNELEKKIKKLDSRFNLSKKYDFKNYKNNKSIIMIEHDCGEVINTS